MDAKVEPSRILPVDPRSDLREQLIRARNEIPGLEDCIQSFQTASDLRTLRNRETAHTVPMTKVAAEFSQPLDSFFLVVREIAFPKEVLTREEIELIKAGNLKAVIANILEDSDRLPISLPIKQHEILKARYVNGVTPESIATQYQVKRDTVLLREWEGRNSIQKWFAQYGVPEVSVQEALKSILHQREIEQIVNQKDSTREKASDSVHAILNRSIDSENLTGLSDQQRIVLQSLYKDGLALAEAQEVIGAKQKSQVTVARRYGLAKVYTLASELIEGLSPEQFKTELELIRNNAIAQRFKSWKENADKWLASEGELPKSLSIHLDSPEIKKQVETTGLFPELETVNVERAILTPCEREGTRAIETTYEFPITGSEIHQALRLEERIAQTRQQGKGAVAENLERALESQILPKMSLGEIAGVPNEQERAALLVRLVIEDPRIAGISEAGAKILRCLYAEGLSIEQTKILLGHVHDTTITSYRNSLMRSLAIMASVHKIDPEKLENELVNTRRKAVIDRINTWNHAADIACQTSVEIPAPLVIDVHAFEIREVLRRVSEILPISDLKGLAGITLFVAEQDGRRTKSYSIERSEERRIKSLDPFKAFSFIEERLEVARREQKESRIEQLTAWRATIIEEKIVDLFQDPLFQEKILMKPDSQDLFTPELSLFIEHAPGKVLEVVRSLSNSDNPTLKNRCKLIARYVSAADKKEVYRVVRAIVDRDSDASHEFMEMQANGAALRSTLLELSKTAKSLLSDARSVFPSGFKQFKDFID